MPLLALAYLGSLRVHPAPRWRRVAFGAGLALVLVAFVSPLQRLALHYLLLAHLLQNVVLAEWAPLLLVAGLAPASAAALGRARGVRILTLPALALPLWLLNYLAWHLPWCYDAALRRPDSLLHVEHLSYLVTGLGFWWPLVHDLPHRLRSGAKALYVTAASLFAGPIGLVLALLPSAVYGFYVEAPRLWGLSPLRDQELAGITMAAEQSTVLFAFFVVNVLRFLREEEASGVTRPRPR